MTLISGSAMSNDTPLDLDLWPAGLHAIRGIFGCCHLLVDEAGVTLIDTGLIGEAGRIRQKLRELGLGPNNVRAVLLTHGHIDHTGNLAWIKHWTGAPIHAHPAEQSHVDGNYPYTGSARWCGRLEWIARTVINYRSVPIDVPLADGQLLPFWGGLQVVHLPGHTLGHCGFYSPRLNLLFCGDLLVSQFARANLPPPFFNSASHLLPASLETVHRLNPASIVPNHYFGQNGPLHRRRFDRLRDRVRARLARRAVV
jgi:glyoxylase-like metal-dependent hydrolase (beta-lactamase superfamily II)